ncbi:MAG: aminotransferase class I/II-fold pyridoxal phosphate-dependent enzyme [Lachnospiraceae bacterium]|nr:aminotransferase class I/II-fold pyridoxal phosphate-dependent enzyme [Lachnospiraceae bacterium]
MDKKKIWLSSPTMHGDEQRFVQEAFDTNWVAPLGPNVDAFEKEVAAYTGSVAACALDSGTAAIHLAVKLAGIQEKDVVLCQDLTFSASCNPVMYEKATPVFVDSEEDTWNMSPEALEEALLRHPEAKAVIVVHLYGTPAKMDAISSICASRGIVLIEDAAEAMGSTYQGKSCGTLGDYGILSFNGNKIITTSGGGMLLTHDEEQAKKVRYLATQAREPRPYYHHTTVGYNYRMSNITAGIGRGQLLHLQEHLEKKQAIYRMYEEALKGLPGVRMNPMNPKGVANNWLSGIYLDDDAKATPMQILEALQAENIESRPIWKPMHLQPVFEEYEFVKDPKQGGRDISAEIFARGLCLPSDIKNTEEDNERILRILKEMLS